MGIYSGDTIKHILETPDLSTLTKEYRTWNHGAIYISYAYHINDDVSQMMLHKVKL